MTKFSQETIKQLNQLYNAGKNDVEISKILGVSDSYVWQYRKDHNLPSKFEYKSKVNKEQFEKYYNLGYSDLKISKIMNISYDAIHRFRLSNNYNKDNKCYNKAIPLTEFQKQVLLGTLLGDSSLRKSSDTANTCVICAHGIKQELYCKHKAEIFKSIKTTVHYHKRNTIDKRTGKYYEDYTFQTVCNPELNTFYYSFYKNNVKVIPFDLFQYLTNVALAYWFMDDGFKKDKTYFLCTNCFKKEELIKLQQVLLDKFNLQTTLDKRNMLRIRNKCANTFKNLIALYIIPSMQYKLCVS